MYFVCALVNFASFAPAAVLIVAAWCCSVILKPCLKKLLPYLRGHAICYCWSIFDLLKQVLPQRQNGFRLLHDFSGKRLLEKGKWLPLGDRDEYQHPLTGTDAEKKNGHQSDARPTNVKNVHMHRWRCRTPTQLKASTYAWLCTSYLNTYRYSQTTVTWTVGERMGDYLLCVWSQIRESWEALGLSFSWVHSVYRRGCGLTHSLQLCAAAGNMNMHSNCRNKMLSFCGPCLGDSS